MPTKDILTYIAIGGSALALVLLVVTIILLVMVIGLRKKYRQFMTGSDGKTLESTILKRFSEIDKLKKETKLTAEKLDVTCDTLVNAFQKVGIVKYDAFSEMGGKLSYSLCLLDDKDNGFIISSIHSREGCHSYIKEIIRGESYVIMSEEEREALQSAQKGTNFKEVK